MIDFIKRITKEAGGVMESLSGQFSLFQAQDVIVGNRILVNKAKELITRISYI